MKGFLGLLFLITIICLIVYIVKGHKNKNNKDLHNQYKKKAIISVIIAIIILIINSFIPSGKSKKENVRNKPRTEVKKKETNHKSKTNSKPKKQLTPKQKKEAAAKNGFTSDLEKLSRKNVGTYTALMDQYGNINVMLSADKFTKMSNDQAKSEIANIFNTINKTYDKFAPYNDQFGGNIEFKSDSNNHTVAYGGVDDSANDITFSNGKDLS